MENVDAVAVPEGVQQVLQNTPDAAARETIRDLASAKSFRRDLWRKGGETLPAREHMALLDAMTLVWTGRIAEGDITFAGPIGEVTGQAEFYRPLLDTIREGPATIGQLRALPSLRDRQPGEFVQGAIMLMGGGYAHPAWLLSAPKAAQQRAREASARLNGAIVDRLRLGVDLLRLATPLTGSSIAIDVMEGLVVGRLLDGGSREPEALIDGVLNDVVGSGRALLRDGQPLADPTEARTVVGEAVAACWRGACNCFAAWASSSKLPAGD